MILPTLERPDAEGAPGARTIALTDWVDGTDPYAKLRPCPRLRRHATRSPTPRGRCSCSASRRPCHDTRYVSMTAALPMLRAIKDADELRAARGRQARPRTRRFEEILKVRFAGRKETEVAADLAELLIDHGHSQVDFTVVGSGPNGANPHHHTGDRVIEQGDSVVFDWGGTLGEGYTSDVTRGTVHVGEPRARSSARSYQIVLDANQVDTGRGQAGLSLPGHRPCHLARKVITDAGYGDAFLHRTGHGLGLDVARRAVSGRGQHDAARVLGHGLQRTSPASTSPAGSGCGSRTSSPSPTTADGA